MNRTASDVVRGDTSYVQGKTCHAKGIKGRGDCLALLTLVVLRLASSCVAPPDG